jgi:hypothetical protein
MDDYIIFSRITERAVQQINAFITSISQEDIPGREAFDFCKLFFYFYLMRIGIPVISR